MVGTAREEGGMKHRRPAATRANPAWYPAWAASKYLVRLSEQADDATRQVVGEVALDILSTGNPWVKTDIVRLCSAPR